MEDNAAVRAVQSAALALGRGFDVNNDTRLLYCKWAAGSRVVELDEERTRDVTAFDDVVVSGVPRDIRVSQEPRGRERPGALSFHEMAECFNRKALLSGNAPLGSFNSAFSFTGSRKLDAAATKCLAFDGVFIPLCKVELVKQPLSLQQDIKVSLPHSWDPSSLARFIEDYGTHVITSITIGGKDVVYVKQNSSSSLSPLEMKNYVQGIGDQRFSDAESHTGSGSLKWKDKTVDPLVFNSQGIYPQPSNDNCLAAKEDVTVIFRRRGGNDLIQNHKQWARTIFSAPDVIEMTFVPITSLIETIPGKDHLVRAISLYMEHKPPIEELRCFLEFQVPRIWAPIRSNIPGHQRKDPVCPYMQFSMMGQKLCVSQEQVSVGRKPVTGLRLCLEGAKQNRLCIYVQHLSSLPKNLLPYWDAHIPIGTPMWQAPEEQDSRWFEPVKWKSFSHVSTTPIEQSTFIGDLSGAHIVTGAQLGVWDFGPKNVLYMKLLYLKVPGCTIRRSVWDYSPANSSDTSSRLSGGGSASSSSWTSASSVDAGVGKLLKHVDVSEMSRGLDDVPGHWLVTGGKLGVEKGKIVLRLKYSLLNY